MLIVAVRARDDDNDDDDEVCLCVAVLPADAAAGSRGRPRQVDQRRENQDGTNDTEESRRRSGTCVFARCVIG